MNDLVGKQRKRLAAMEGKRKEKKIRKRKIMDCCSIQMGKVYFFPFGYIVYYRQQWTTRTTPTTAKHSAQQTEAKPTSSPAQPPPDGTGSNSAVCPTKPTDRYPSAPTAAPEDRLDSGYSTAAGTRAIGPFQLCSRPNGPGFRGP